MHEICYRPDVRSGRAALAWMNDITRLKKPGVTEVALLDWGHVQLRAPSHDIWISPAPPTPNLNRLGGNFWQTILPTEELFALGRFSHRFLLSSAILNLLAFDVEHNNLVIEKVDEFSANRDRQPFLPKRYLRGPHFGLGTHKIAGLRLVDETSAQSDELPCRFGVVAVFLQGTIRGIWLRYPRVHRFRASKGVHPRTSDSLHSKLCLTMRYPRVPKQARNLPSRPDSNRLKHHTRWRKSVCPCR